MDILNVSDCYNVYIDNSIKGLYDALKANINKNEKIFFVTDSCVNKNYEDLINNLSKAFNADVCIINHGEENKNYDTINYIYSFLIDGKADRNSIIIAIGGGVVGDLTAFTAATFMRGIKFINVPTTLVSQVDSCIGGKSGYNFKEIKNVIGCFHNPEFVYISTHFLKSLNRNQLLDGFGEIIKYGLTIDKDILEFLDMNSNNLFLLEDTVYMSIIKKCINIKSNVIDKDFTDKAFRNILNFGHTTAHAIEVESNYSVPHGIAVALGILTALKLSEQLFDLNKGIYKDTIKLYTKLGMPSSYKVDNYEAFLYAIKHDKKNNDKINFVLLEDLNRCKIKVEVNEDDILLALKNSIDK
ncbi:3-dehydroquinate synthase [Clostridiales bacterium oral taxon 876 str. F0540]|nr:3-dehydroquinate synthase [Clostridiales bacterium oral taxon 876 str. F0540]